MSKRNQRRGSAKSRNFSRMQHYWCSMYKALIKMGWEARLDPVKGFYMLAQDGREWK